VQHLERTEPVYFSTSCETSFGCCLSHQKRYTTPSVQRTHRTSYGVVVVRLPRGVNFLPFRVFCWGNLLFFVQLGGPGRPEFGALGWSCVVVEMLCVGLILFVFVFFLFFLLIKFTAKICGPVQKKVTARSIAIWNRDVKYLSPRARVPRTVGNRTGSAGSRWNRADPVHEPVRFPPTNSA
jgi:hypothetical protein